MNDTDTTTCCAASPNATGRCPTCGQLLPIVPTAAGFTATDVRGQPFSYIDEARRWVELVAVS